MAFLTGNDIGLKGVLNQPLDAISQSGSARIRRNTSRLKENAIASNASSDGRRGGGYQDFAIDQAANLAERQKEGALFSVLGDASYNETLAKNKDTINRDLAMRLGKQLQPSPLLSILNGLPSLVPLAAAGKQIYGSAGSGPSGGPVPYGTAQNPFGTEDALDRIRGYPQLPSLVRNQ